MIVEAPADAVFDSGELEEVDEVVEEYAEQIGFVVVKVVEAVLVALEVCPGWRRVAVFVPPELFEMLPQREEDILCTVPRVDSLLPYHRLVDYSEQQLFPKHLY